MEYNAPPRPIPAFLQIAAFHCSSQISRQQHTTYMCAFIMHWGVCWHVYVSCHCLWLHAELSCAVLPNMQAVAGLLPDGRQVVNRAQDEATSYKS